jgi:hypothetical protein
MIQTNHMAQNADTYLLDVYHRPILSIGQIGAMLCMCPPAANE